MPRTTSTAKKKRVRPRPYAIMVDLLTPEAKRTLDRIVAHYRATTSMGRIGTSDVIRSLIALEAQRIFPDSNPGH